METWEGCISAAFLSLAIFWILLLLILISVSRSYIPLSPGPIQKGKWSHLLERLVSLIKYIRCFIFQCNKPLLNHLNMTLSTFYHVIQNRHEFLRQKTLIS